MNENSSRRTIGLVIVAVGLSVLIYNVFNYRSLQEPDTVHRPVVATSTIPTTATSTPTINFNERGHVVMRSTGSYLIYEHPGQPALETKLIFNVDSTCTNGERSIQCILLSQTLDVFTENKLVHVVGAESDSVTTIHTLTVIE
jgi:hypothetical protein